MKCIDITADKRKTYTLRKNERCVFLMFNRSGEITFELAGIGAEARIFAFFIGTKNVKGALSITQKHLAARTASRALIKNVLFDESECDCAGLINVNKQARESDVSQEIRSLLLSPLARVSAKPALEIFANDIKCRHAATAGALNPEALFFTRARGLSLSQAENLLACGFIQSSLDEMQKYVSSENNEKILNLESRIKETLTRKKVL